MVMWQLQSYINLQINKFSEIFMSLQMDPWKAMLLKSHCIIFKQSYFGTPKISLDWASSMFVQLDGTVPRDPTPHNVKNFMYCWEGRGGGSCHHFTNLFSFSFICFRLNQLNTHIRLLSMDDNFSQKSKKPI